MTIDWFHFLFAILLLWLPRQALRGGAQLFKRRHRSRRKGGTVASSAKSREPGDLSISFRTEFGKLRNYIDLLRGALGGVLLMGGVPGILPAMVAADDALPTTLNLLLTGQLLILFIGVLIQSFRFEGRTTMFAAIFFVGGLSLCLVGPSAALFAFVLIWTINMALPNPRAFMLVYSVLLAVFCALFRGFSEGVPYVAAGLCFLPPFLSLLIRRPMVLFSKKTKVAGAAEES